MEKEKFEKRIHDFITEKDKQEGTINQMLQMDIVSIHYENKSIVLSFSVEKWALNTANNLHGGIICSVLDVAMGCISYACSDAIFTPTIQMSVNFVKGTQANDTLYIEVYCDHIGKRMIQTRAIAKNSKNVIVATAHASYAINTNHRNIN